MMRAGLEKLLQMCPISTLLFELASGQSNPDIDTPFHLEVIEAVNFTQCLSVELMMMIVSD